MADLAGKFICFDTEDDSRELLLAGKSGFGKRVTQIAAITSQGKQFYNEGDVPAFLRWLQRQPEKFIYAHNLQYDIGNLFSLKLDALDVTFVGGRLIKVLWEGKVFVDSFNFWPCSVAQLGNAFGLKKLETESMAFDREYVFRDVEIIHRAMSFAWNFGLDLGLEKLPTTYAGLGILLWRAWGGECVHDSLEFSRGSIYGGRVELFKVRNETEAVCWTDINSLYPSVMRGEYPGELEDWGRKLPPYGVANVTVKAPEAELCVLPWRSPGLKTFYPWGRFTGTWSIPEIRLAESEGVKILRVNEAWGSAEATRPYADYVTKLYGARGESQTPAEKLFFKFLMNCRYGRMGMQGEVGRTIWQTAENRDSGVPFGDKVLTLFNLPLPPETNWSHAAYTAAYGRIELFKYLKACGAGALIYCDTDSVIWDCPSRQIPFPVGDGLGEMRLVQWCGECETFAPKVYRADGIYRAKGIPRKLAQTFVEQEHVEFDMPYRFREAISYYDANKRGFARWPNTHRLSVWHREQRKLHRRYDRKRLFRNRFFPLQAREKRRK